MGVISPSISPSLAALHDRISQIQSQLAAPGFSSALAQATATSTATATSAAPATTATGVATAASAPPPTWATAAAPSAATAAPGTASGSSGPATGEQIVALAERHLGVPYRWGGTDPAHGLDCSGLVQVVFRDAGIELPRVSRDQARVGTPVASLADARPGDLVAFGSPVDHIGIYAGNGEMVVAPQTGDVVKVQKIGSRVPTAIRRVV